MDPQDAYEVAWGTIVERLYAATEPPEPGWLVWEARGALGHYGQAQMRARGIRPKQREPMPGFWAYWIDRSRATPGPEARVVNRTALAQIWAALTPGARETLAALAATGNDYPAAATMLGVTERRLRDRVYRARGRFLALWHEHETPWRVWRMDGRDPEIYRQLALRRGHHQRCPCLRCNPANIRRERKHLPETTVTTAVRPPPPDRQLNNPEGVFSIARTFAYNPAMYPTLAYRSIFRTTINTRPCAVRR